MNPLTIIITSVLYLGLLFFIAAWVEKKGRKKIINNPYVYALSLAVYCTAWTFYGSVGRAATGGISFLPIYLGPTLLAPLWMIVLRKMILISQYQRITSVADFVSSRYGKSASLGLLCTILAILAVIPYISIQLKAISYSFDILLGNSGSNNVIDSLPFYKDSALYITIALSFFIILFGTRKLDPNEKHTGLIGAIAFDSVIKLIAFLAIGIFVTFGLFNGFGDLFSSALEDEQLSSLFTFKDENIEGHQWFWLILLSMFAILLLPRQFHVAVVENTNPNFLRKASWLFPLYLLLINIFVLPIAIGGLIYFPDANIEPDTFVLSLPLSAGKPYLALFIALGGFAAATSMMIVSVIALSIMMSNNLVLPFLITPKLFKGKFQGDLTQSLIGIRRVSILTLLLLAYAFFRSIAQSYSLVSIGLISFVGIAQFGPALLGGLYWKGATKKGAFAGILVGALVWFYTLPFPTLIESGVFSISLLEEGPFGISILKPYQLFGLIESNIIIHSAFWSLLLNTATYFMVSLVGRPTPLVLSQADVFVDIYKYQSSDSNVGIRKRKAKVKDIRLLLNRFLGLKRTEEIFGFYQKKSGFNIKDEDTGMTDLVNLAETHLAGSIGASSAKVLIGTISKEDPISLEEMFRVLEQTQEIIEYSKALERKSVELETTTIKLRNANDRLKELDRLKADFITTVTHELRTPITSIKALAKILHENKDIDPDQHDQFLEIMVSESERIARLINQVLDLEKLERKQEDPFEAVDFTQIASAAFESLSSLAKEESIAYTLQGQDVKHIVLGNKDRLQQVVVNLISNAIKFCHQDQGVISVILSESDQQVFLAVKDNGDGIPEEKQKLIFERFTQISNQQQGKPQGSGLGLFITQSIVQNHQGVLEVNSQIGQGTTFTVSLPKFLIPLDALTFEGEKR